ncbi:DNA circularization N-terminal domain-containing protein [Brevundimonas vitis]|uniref:DNA circularization N-terminal domain-containing protein n=1 Tax=Brevundimonas vitisensis TaxID=2800818 RepID=A0ABX7BQY2_9CAUL|nr:DNA circularization N-terminal domain-containing protein [Brevundimonas vitisensis]QQQ19667.1 DNA circularization N-terminal domain-containing protein [Brevundimonas vitisensis]
MGWRDRLREASFRGVAFLVDSHDHDFGRRVDVHEYALRATPWVEDLGRAGRRYSLDAYLLGPDYDLARAQLIAALETEGPATLVHPWLGSVTVSCTTSSLRETIRRGGEASFRLDFVEAGENVAPDAGDDTATLARDAATQAGDEAARTLATGFDVTGQPGFVVDAAVARVSQAADALDALTAPVRRATAEAGAFLRRAQRLRTTALALARSPGDLAAEMLGLVREAARLAQTPRDALVALSPLMQFAETAVVVAGLTPARRRQARNDGHLVRFVRQAAAAEAVRAVTEIAFTAYDEASNARDRLSDAIDAIAIDAADAGDDAAFAALEDLRRAMVRDVAARGGNLARLIAWPVTTDRPLLVIAHQLYGDADRAEELAVRNGIAHPGFLAAGTVLQALASDGRGSTGA